MLLLLSGADVNAADKSNQTALAWAKKRGQTEAAELLVKAGGKELPLKKKEDESNNASDLPSPPAAS
jgi:ankyrin repeat protein